MSAKRKRDKTAKEMRRQHQNHTGGNGSGNRVTTNPMKKLRKRTA